LITTLDAGTSWQSELVSGNGQFVEVGSVLWVVSQSRATNPQTFIILKSNPAPPDPGPGYSFTTVATYTFPQSTSSFDPVVAYDSSTQLLHILGTQDNGHNVDLIKFKFDTTNNTLSAPTTIVTASFIRDGYDIRSLVSGGTFLAVAVTDPQAILRSSGTVNTSAAVTNVSLTNNIVTLTATTGFLPGDSIVCSGFSKAAFLNGQTLVVATSSGTNITAAFVGNNFSSTADNGQIRWLSGHTLIGIDLDSTTTPITGSPVIIASSPTRNGDVFGSVSVISPDGLAIEVYFQTHPKSFTFQDLPFNIKRLQRASTLTWENSPTTLTSFPARYGDNRLTVIAKSNERYLSQVFFSQTAQPNQIFGNLLLGYQSTPGGAWNFNIVPGTLAGSITQATLSVSATQGVNVAYLLQNLAVPSTTVWPVHIASVNLTTLNITDVPGFYNNLPFTWLRGSKSLVDNTSLWAFIGERTVGGNNTPVYVSDYNVPPVAVLQPASATVHRGQAFTLDSGQTADGDADSLTFTWSENDPDTINVTLTPSDSQATLLVNRAVGGAARSFKVAVVAVDSKNATPLHPALSVTNITIASNILTVTAANTLVAGEQVLLYNLTAATFLNTAIVTVATASGLQFTASFTHANYPSTPETGFAIVSPQFAICNVTVPLNVAPTIDFSHDAISHQAVTLPIDAGRNVVVVINPTITGVTDIDDSPLYTWTQTSGTPVTILGTMITPSISFTTNGVNVNGEALIFQLTVDDGVNAPVSSTVTVNVAAYSFSGLDSHALARSIAMKTSTITNVGIASNVLTVISNNSFQAGQSVFLTGLTSAASLFLNNQTVTLLTASPTQFTATFTHANYAPAAETGTATSASSIFQRNTANIWSPLALSGMFTDLTNIKRTSVLDGTDRYICMSRGSVQILGGINPTLILLRKLFTPGAIPILDAVHNEDDWTLVLDSNNNLYRYTTAPAINTDNPDTTINLSIYSGLTFNKVYTTSSFSNSRIVLLTGSTGGLLLQVRNSDLQVQGFMELTSASGFVYGSNNIQWIRMSNVESLRTGKILIGSVTNVVSSIASVNITSNALTVITPNTFKPGDNLTFFGLTTATFLNGVTVRAVVTSPNHILASFVRSNYATASDTGTISAPGKSYETLIDLAHGQIIGTWDASNVRNSFVNTGEILFEPISNYSGRTQFPTQLPITLTGNVATLTWTHPRPDLITSYNVQYSTDDANSWSLYGVVNSGAVTQLMAALVPGATYAFRVQAVSPDGPSIFSNIEFVHVGSLNPPLLAPVTQVTASGPNYIFSLNWAAHNPDAPAITNYSLEMQVNNGVYSVIYTGTGTTFTTSALAAGTYGFRVRALVTVQGIYTPYSSTQVIEPITITTLTPPAAPLNQLYSYTMVATGGVVPYTWTVQSGSLPTGLTINANTGVISGTPTVGGTYTPTIRVTDSASPTPMFKQNGISIVAS
jgi:hypothetical protein